MTSSNTSLEYQYPLPTTITIGVLTSLVAIGTSVLNAFTLVAFVFSRSLRNFGDYFIMNLAIADLAIGVLSIPPYIPFTLTGRWTGGKPYCLFWLLWDYVTPAASTFNMCVVSIDRYLLVAHPIWYRRCQSTRLLLLMMLTPWVIVTLVYAPAILLWELVSGEETIEEGKCYVPYAFNVPFLLFGSFIEFVFPLCVMSVINLLIFTNIRQRMKKRLTGTLAPQHTNPATSVFSTQVAPVQHTPLRRPPGAGLKPLTERQAEHDTASGHKHSPAKSALKRTDGNSKFFNRSKDEGKGAPCLSRSKEKGDSPQSLDRRKDRGESSLSTEKEDCSHSLDRRTDKRKTSQNSSNGLANGKTSLQQTTNQKRERSGTLQQNVEQQQNQTHSQSTRPLQKTTMDTVQIQRTDQTDDTTQQCNSMNPSLTSGQDNSGQLSETKQREDGQQLERSQEQTIRQQQNIEQNKHNIQQSNGKSPPQQGIETGQTQGPQPRQSSRQQGTDPIQSSQQQGTDPIQSSQQQGTETIQSSQQEGTETTQSSQQQGTDPIQSSQQQGTDPIQSSQQQGTETKQSSQQEGTETIQNSQQQGTDPIQSSQQKGTETIQSSQQEGTETIQSSQQQGRETGQTQATEPKQSSQHQSTEPPQHERDNGQTQGAESASSSSQQRRQKQDTDRTQSSPQQRRDNEQTQGTEPTPSSQEPPQQGRDNGQIQGTEPAQNCTQPGRDSSRQHSASSKQQTSASPEGQAAAASERSRLASHFRRDRRAARSLFILVFIFTLCWLPYEVLALVTAVCPTCIHPVLFEVSFWMLWVNSLINPILYPLLHRRFREAFVALLRRAKCYCC